MGAAMMRLGWIVPVVGLLAVGCGDDGDVLRASGSVRLTVHQPGQTDGTAEFLPPGETAIDPPPGIGQGVYGTCRKTASGWSVTLTRADASTVGLRGFAAVIPAGNASGGASLSFTLGTSVFQGSTTCQASATSEGERGVRIEARCTALAAPGDPRTVDAVVSLALANCSDT